MDTNTTAPEGKQKCACGIGCKCGKCSCIKKIICKIVLILIVIAAIAALQPGTMYVERSAYIAAPPSAVFAQVNNMHNWESWSPWKKMDPESTATFAGPEAGKDAAMSWEGKKTGKGTMTITESVPDQKVVFRLDFQKPMKGTDTAEFNFATQGSGTLVTWSMNGDKNFIAKVMGLFMNCEKFIGDQFSDGLNNIKAIVAPK